MKNMKKHTEISQRLTAFFICLSAILWLLPGCASASKKGESEGLSLKEYSALTWEEKTDYFEKNPRSGQAKERALYEAALRDKYAPVPISALKAMSDDLVSLMRPDLLELLQHEEPMVRWNVCKNLTRVPEDKDLKKLQDLAGDQEWLCRECYFRGLRNYESEKRKKKYFFAVVSSINEKNVNVLREIYRTLIWYEDARALPYLYKRSYHTDSRMELIAIMQELAVLKNDEVRRMLSRLASRHKDYYVRNEALRLLGEM